MFYKLFSFILVDLYKYNKLRYLIYNLFNENEQYIIMMILIISYASLIKGILN